MPITKILLIVLIVLIIRSLMKNFIISDFLGKKQQDDSASDDVIDVDYEDID